MATLNRNDKIWLWIIGLVSFAAFVMLLLFLSPGVYQLFLIFCEAQSTGPDKRPGIFCCRQPHTCCEDTGEKPSCEETKSGNEVTLNLGNNRQVNRLISAIEGLGNQHLVIKQQNPHSLKLEDSPQLGKLVSAIEGLSRQHLVIEQQKSHSLKLELENNPQVERLISAVETRIPQYPVTEQRLPSYLAEKTACGNARFDMSDFIRFDWMKSDLDDAAKTQIADFMERSGQVKKLRVFGFASPDGREGHNKGLAEDRANVVMEEIKNRYPACSYSDSKIKPIGENHPINGIANSRSAVIVACREQPGESK